MSICLQVVLFRVVQMLGSEGHTKKPFGGPAQGSQSVQFYKVSVILLPLILYSASLPRQSLCLIPLLSLAAHAICHISRI